MLVVVYCCELIVLTSLFFLVEGSGAIELLPQWAVSYIVAQQKLIGSFV